MIDIPVYRDGPNILARQREIEENEAHKAELKKNLKMIKVWCSATDVVKKSDRHEYRIDGAIGCF